MAQIKITFEKEINSSLQAKDIAYFSKTKSALTISEPSRLGIVVLIRRDLNYIVVDVDLTDPAITGFVAQDFVFFRTQMLGRRPRLPMSTGTRGQGLVATTSRRESNCSPGLWTCPDEKLPLWVSKREKTYIF